MQRSRKAFYPGVVLSGACQFAKRIDARSRRIPAPVGGLHGGSGLLPHRLLQFLYAL